MKTGRPPKILNKLPGKDLSIEQLRAIEMLVNRPGISYSDIASACDVERMTLYRWRKDSVFCTEYLKQAAVYHSSFIPQVDRRMINKAIAGDVAAANYLKDVYGRSNRHVSVRILSPYELFSHNSDSNKFGDGVIEGELIDDKLLSDVNEVLAGFDPDDLGGDASVEDGRDNKRRWRSLRYRAKKIGYPSMPPGRPSEEERRLWERGLNELEDKLLYKKDNKQFEKSFVFDDIGDDG